MRSEPITSEKIDQLLVFLPLFDESGKPFVKQWAGGEKPASGAITMPYPVYTDDVLEFFRLAGQPCWSDYEYKPADGQRMVADDECIAQATPEDIKTMLTYCVRGERFCDGHWERVLKAGRITMILRRLAVLRESFDSEL